MPRSFGSFVIDAVAVASLAGIWPRFIEPKLLKTTHLSLSLPSLRGLKQKIKIVHFTDLHFHKGSSSSFFKKVQKTILDQQADLLCFTGDFLCYSQLEAADQLLEFLEPLKAPLGSFCVFGNHDYERYVSRDSQGNYTVRSPIPPLQGALRGVRTLFSKKNNIKGKVSEEAARTKIHPDLKKLLAKTPFTVLENSAQQLPIGLNIVGLGEYGLGKCLPDCAFKNLNPQFPTLLLLHNPDALPLLQDYPTDLILAGHTHGEQIYLPFPLRKLSQKLTRLENPQFSRGLYRLGSKTLYVNRGISGHKPFRFCSIPEILTIICQ